MKANDRELDPELEWLRNAYRARRAPEALRRRVLRRAPRVRGRPTQRRARSARWLSGGGLLGLAAAVCGCVWLAVAWLASSGSGGGVVPVAGLDLFPTAEPASTPSACPTPLPSSPWKLNETDPGAQLSGFEPQVLDLETRGCGLMTRRYLLRVPPGDTPSTPVLLVLHDAGESAEQVQISTRWWFEDLARRERAVLVYANGAPIATGWMYAGVWQTDERAHPAVDDVAYLQAIVDELHDERRIAERGEVFLSGYGSGAQMALVAALQRPEYFSGVAAFLPAHAPAESSVVEAPHSIGHGKLRSILIVLSGASAREASPLAARWVSALGGEPASLRMTHQARGVQRVDTSLPGGIALRIFELQAPVVPFPLPGGGDELARAASAARASFFDGPGAAWDFFQQGKHEAN